MNQSHTATMQFDTATTRAGLAHWWTGVEHAVAAAVHRAFAPPAPVPSARTVHLSYLERACMAREMDRL